MLPRVLRRWALALLLVPVGSGALGAEPPRAERSGERYGEPIAFRRVAVPDDVPAHLVTALAEDADGFLWIGTQGGLVRFDGTGFRVFASTEDETSLGGSYVRCLLPARDGRLWVGTFGGGLSVFDPAEEKFRRFRHDPADPGSLGSDRVEGLAEDRDGSVWAATAEGLERIDPRSGAIEHFRHDPADAGSLADDRLRAVLVDREGVLWVGGRDGLQRRPPGRSFERVASAPGEEGSLAGQSVAKLFEDSAGRLWIGTTEHGAAVLGPGGGLRRLRPRPAQPDGLSHFWVYGFAEVAEGEIWIATFGGGIDVVDAASLAISQRLRADPHLPEALSADRVGALLRGSAGLVWVGTWGQGLLLHDPSSRAFRVLRSSPNRPEGLSHGAAVRSLERGDGSIWVGTNGHGIDVLSPRLELRRGYRPAKEDPGALANGAVTCLAEGPDGSLWVATLDGTLHRQRPGQERFERLGPADGLPGGQIRAITFGPAGELWAGSSEGLARIDPAGGAIKAYRHRPGDADSLSGNAVEAIAFDAAGRLFVGTDSGLDLFDSRRGEVVRSFRHQPGDPRSLPNNWVPDLMLARDGSFWVGTHGGAAILRWSAAGEPMFESVAEKIGQPARAVESLIEDAEGQVWLGPRLRIEPKTWKASSFGPADGCGLRSFFIASRFRRQDGSLLFGSPEGLLVVDPARLAPWTFAPKVVATALKVDGEPLPGAARRGRLELEPGQKSFSLDVAALDFTAPEHNRYRYRLEGYESAWQETDAVHNTLTYTNLRPGDYRLRVLGSNRAGSFSPRQLELAVRVEPAFYQTGFFRLLAAGLLLAGGYGLYRLRLYQLERRSRALELLVKERTAELEAAYRRIEDASLRDPLTGLRNRRFLEQVLPADLELALRRCRDGEKDCDLVFFLMDLDHFKSVNDTWGHAAGDAVLVETARRLAGALRASDHLLRWGGEEFLAVARFVSSEEGPALAEKLRQTVAAAPYLLPNGERIERTVSIGFAAYPFDAGRPEAVGWEKILHYADLALYAAKESGRNRARGYGESMDGIGNLSSEPAATS
jgi:diguanylate cyclase (GGDEF)-like protein